MLLHNIDILIYEIQLNAIKNIAQGGLKLLGNTSYIGTHGIIDAGKALISGNKTNLLQSLKNTKQQLKHSYDMVYAKKIVPHTMDAKKEINDLYRNPNLRTSLKYATGIGAGGAGLYFGSKYLLSHPLASAAIGSSKKAIDKTTGYE